MTSSCSSSISDRRHDQHQAVPVAFRSRDGLLGIWSRACPLRRRRRRLGLGELRVREIITPVVDRALAVVKKQSRGQARTAKVVISQVNAVGGTAQFGGVQPYP